MNYFYNYQSDAETEQNTFFSILYHDYRNGQIFRLIKRGGDVNQVSTCDIGELACTGTDGDVYTSINTFRGTRRTSDKLFNRTAIYLDLDCHDYATEAELESVINRTVRILETAYQCGTLPIPTMVTATGRGLGIYYVLNRSIANVPSAESSMRFFDRVYDGLIGQYQHILASCADGRTVLSVDTKVRDASRITRTPGTYNSHNGRMCRLISVNFAENGHDRLYELRDLMQPIMTDYAQDNSRRAKIINFNAYTTPFLEMRVKRLQQLQSLRGDACVNNCREMMTFIVYSSLVQIHPHDQAVEKLREFNAAFATPLSTSEVEHIISETDAHVVPEGRYEGCRGFYPYSDMTIIRALDITDDEIKKVGFGTSWQRQKTREENQKKRNKRNQEIADAIKNNPEVPYADIAGNFCVSTKTVERVAKQYGVMRYNRRKTEETKPSAARVIPFLAGDGAIGVETDKKCLESWCVPGVSDTLSFLLSLLQVAGWGTAAQNLQRLVQEALVIPNDQLQHATETLIFALQKDVLTLSKPYLLSAVYKVMHRLAVWITSYDYAHGLIRPYDYDHEPKRKNIYRMPIKVKDKRFDVIENDNEYQHRLDSAVFKMVKKAFHDLKFIRRESFIVNGKILPKSEIEACFDGLSYKDIVIITERIAGKCGHPRKPLFYVIKSVWCYRHPEDADHLTDNGDNRSEKPVNDFCNFKQRHYDASFYDMLETLFLNV